MCACVCVCAEQVLVYYRPSTRFVNLLKSHTDVGGAAAAAVLFLRALFFSSLLDVCLLWKLDDRPGQEDLGVKCSDTATKECKYFRSPCHRQRSASTARSAVYSSIGATSDDWQQGIDAQLLFFFFLYYLPWKRKEKISTPTKCPCVCVCEHPTVKETNNCHQCVAIWAFLTLIQKKKKKKKEGRKNKSLNFDWKVNGKKRRSDAQ